MEQFREKIETLSNLFINSSVPPVAARIYNYILLKPEGEATFDELCNYFKVSKSAVSNGLKLLVQHHALSVKNKYGQRKRYYSPIIDFNIIVERMVESHKLFNTHIEGVLEARTTPTEVDRHLNKMKVFLSFIEEEFPKMIRDFEEKYKLKYNKN